MDLTRRHRPLCAEPVPRPADRPRLPEGFPIVWLAVALDLVGFGIVIPILPVYATEFGAGPAAAAAVVATFSAAQFVFAPLWGRLSDRVGRRPALALALVGSTIGSLVTGLAGALWVVFLGRIIDGASGSSYAVGQAAVADMAAPGERRRLLGLLASAFGLGFVLGPLIGSLAALGSDKLPFFVAAALSAVNALLVWSRVPETNCERVASRPVVSFQPGRRIAAARSQQIVGLVAVSFVAMAGFSGFETTLSLLLESRFGLAPSSIYGIFALIGLVLVFVQVRLVAPVGSLLPGARGLAGPLVVTAAGLALLAPDGGWVLLPVALLLIVVGQGLLGPLLAAVFSERAEPAMRGEVLGIQQSAGSLGRIIGPLVGGVLFEAAVPLPYAVGAAALVLAAVVAINSGRGDSSVG